MTTKAVLLITALLGIALFGVGTQYFVRPDHIPGAEVTAGLVLVAGLALFGLSIVAWPQTSIPTWLMAIYAVSCVGLLVWAAGPIYLFGVWPSLHSIPQAYAGIWVAGGYLCIGSLMLAIWLERRSFYRIQISHHA